MTIQRHVQKKVENSECSGKYNKIEKYWHELIVSLDLVTIAAIIP